MAAKNIYGETKTEAKARRKSEGPIPMGKTPGAGVLASAGSVAKKIKQTLARREGRALTPSRQQKAPQYGPGSQSNDQENYD